MKTSIIKIGNSRGVRIPKVVLEEANLGEEIELRTDGNKIILSPAQPDKGTPPLNEEYLLSLSVLSKEWDTPEEDEAWAYLQ